MPSTRPTIDRPARRRTASLRRALLLSSCAAAVAPMSGGVALAGRGVKLDGVAAGAASIARAGPLTTVTASDGSILRFNSFDVARGQSVRFVQPSAQARALARIGGSAPSRIDGNLSANGILYLVNPAGVIFGGGAVVNVGHLYAAAGSISDADFRAGVDRFTHVSGAVSNLGSIRGDSVFLIGNNVSNGGTITAEGGTIAMIAGDEALLTNLDDHLVVRVRADALAPAATATTPQLEQSGQLSAPRGRVLLAAGDHYSLAVGGRVRAATVAVQGGVGSTATLHGTIDVSNAQAKGGDAHVSATHVALSGATIDAGGATAGGGVSIEAAGAATAARVDVDVHSTIKASATAVDGVGGTIRMTSDGVTSVGGTLAATGGAAGGLIETSAANSLRVTSVPDASASRATGKAGTWLMDPGNVQIVDDEADGFLPAEADGETTIHNRTIDAALNGGTSVTISTGTGADFDIVQGTAITKSAGNAATLTLNASRNVELNAPITSTSGALNLVVNANLADDAVKEERSAVGGTVVLAASMSLAGGSLTVAGLATNVREKIDAGDVTFDSAVVMRPEAQIVARSVSFGSAAIVAGSIKASGPVTFAAPITLAADTTITTTGGKGSGVTFPSTVDTLTAGELEFADAAFDATVPTQNASLTVTASGPIRFDGTIGGDLPTGGGSGGARALLDFKACSETVLTLNVPSINATRDVDLNFCGKTTIPATATIVGPQDDLHIVAGREISSGVNEKITVVGALRLDAPTVTVGDVSTLGDFDVNTQTLIIRRRAAGQVLGRNGSMTNDLGVDIVSGGDIDLNATGTVQLRGTSGRLFLAAGGTITRTPFEADTIEHSAALRVTPDDFSFGGTVLDLDAGSASGGDPSPPIAGAVPRVNLVIDSDLRRPKEGIAVSAALREVLNDLGVYARVLAPTEYVELTRGFGTYDDVPKRLGAEDDEYTVAINRLQYDPVIPVAQQYYTLFYGKPLDLKSGRPSLVAADRRDGEIKRELGGGWAAFEAASDGKADPGAFEAYLRADPTRADAAATLADLRSLFRAVDGLGLNPNEVRIAKAILVRRSLPPQMRPSDMIGALRAPPASGSPAAAPSLVAGPGAKPTASTITP